MAAFNTSMAVFNTRALMQGAIASTSGRLSVPSWPLAVAALPRSLHAAVLPASHTRQHSSQAGNTGSKQLPPGGPARAKLRALPFRVSAAQADAAFASYHGSGWLQSRQAPAIDTRREVYLPFWVGSAQVTTTVHSAEVGTSQLVNRYNPATKRYEPQWETRWRRVALQRLSWQHEFPPEEAAMELYASWKFPRGDIAQLRPGALLQTATSLTPAMMDDSGGGVRRVGPFNMPPEVARKQLRSIVEAAEQARAEEAIQQLMKVNQVRFIDMTIRYAGGAGGPTVAPVYVPAHVFSWVHAGVKVRTYVSGVDAGQVAGSRLLDESKVATLAAVTASGALWVLGVPVTSSAFLWAGLAIPFTLGGLAARYWPALRAYYQAVNTAASEAWNSRGADGATWDAEFVHAYWRGEGRRHSQERQQQEAWQEQQQQGRQQGQWQQWWEQQQQQQRQRQRPASGHASSSDPQGYYATLGVTRDASQDEIQAAFRGLALKHHPDRYTNEADKAAATAKFQGISAAYHVLRDPAKRRAYDAGMQQ